MSETKLIKDVPVGVLLLVLSQFVVYAIIQMANHPQWYELFGIMIGSIIVNDLVSFGIKLIKGFERDSDEQ